MGNPKTRLEREMTLKTNKLRDAISFALVGTSAFAATGVAFAEDKKDSDQLDTVVDKLTRR